MSQLSDFRKVIGAIIGVPLALVMIYRGLEQYSSASELKAQGVEVAGQVINSRMERARKSTKYFLSVSYTPQERESAVEREFEVSTNGYNKGRKSESVKVRYLPKEPRTAQIVGEETQGYLYLGLGSVTIFGCAVVLCNCFLDQKD